MKFYLATSFIFPRDFRLRLFALCFLGTHLPLISYIGWSLAAGRIAWDQVILLTLATLAGTLLALLGIGALLGPVGAAVDAMRALERGQPLQPLPQTGDILGELLGSINKAATATSERTGALEQAAAIDPLTGVANRRGFLAAVQGFGTRERRGVVALIDLDFFKKINDRFGHDVGDQILRDFAQRLSREVRRDDVVGRWGGEEFALLLPSISEEDAAFLLERVANSIANEPVTLLDGQSITFSAGVAPYSAPNIDQAMKLADEALYDAKHAGRSTVRMARRAVR